MMRKCTFILILCLSFLLSGLSTPAQSVSNEEIVDYLIFFRDQQNLGEKINWMNQFQQWDRYFETKTFEKLSICQVKATSKTFRFIQQHYPDAMFYPNYHFSASPVSQEVISAPDTSTIPWNLESIHANWLWEQGYTGKNVHLGVLDTGVDGSHKDLQGKINHFAFIDRSGYVVKEEVAYDTDTHGTHVSGIIAGGSTQKPLGVSPDSMLSVGVVIPGGGGSFVQILAGLEWMLDPDQNPATEDAPHAVNLSLGAPGYLSIWSSILTKMLNRNILPIFSVGNDGDGITSTPGNTPLSFSAGALDIQNNIGTFSSGADHLYWEDKETVLLDYSKPDVSAPGVNVVSSVPGNKYAAMSGSSMAAPHLTGAVGLLVDAFPDISAFDLRAYIEASAMDLGVSGADTRYGKGKLDVKQAYLNLSSSVKVTGQIKNASSVSLRWRELNRSVYVNPQGAFVSYLNPGSYHLDFYINRNLVQSIPVLNLEKPIHLSAEIPPVTETLIEGKVMDAKGNPLSAIVVSSEETVQTNTEGFFQLKTNLFETIEILCSGYQNKTICIQKPGSYCNVKLLPADLLLIEGNSLMNTMKNPPRDAKQFYTKALDDLKVSYSYFDSSKYSLTWDYIKNFDSVIAFYPSGTVTYDEGIVLAKYLEAGGRLIISGRLLFYLEQYLGNDFLQTYYGVTSRYTLASPSVISYSENGPFAGFFFPLSGDEGANNQEYCEILQKNESGKVITPLLRYADATKEAYSAISISNGRYRSILMSFGFEGIGNPLSRLEWMRAMLSWLKDTQTIHIQLNESVSPHFIRIKKNNQNLIEQIADNNEVIFRNLEAGDYDVTLHTFGFESENFKTTIQSGDYYSIQSFPKASPYQPVQLQFETSSDHPIYYQLYFYSRLIKEDILTFPVLKESLPSGNYTLIAYSSSLSPLKYYINVTDQPIDIKLELTPMKKKVLLVNNSATGNFFVDNYLRLGDFYKKFFTSVSYGVDFWDVSDKGFPTKLDLLPYQVVYYFSGINQNALLKPEHLSVLSFYLDQGGKVILNGNCHHSNLKGTAFLQKYFGIDIYSPNVREQTVIGNSHTIMDGLLIDLSDSMTESGILTPYPSLTKLNDTVVTVFSYLSGKVSSTYYKQENYSTLYITFGLDNVTKSSVRLDLVNKSIQLMIEGMKE